MVRVLKCHSFASQQVIPVSKEPLAICAEEDKVFIATRDCEIIILKDYNGHLKEIQRIPSISLVDLIVYNAFKDYIVTIELKKSWKRETRSVYVYLNWLNYSKESGKPRTVVSVAGRSHIQHSANPTFSDIMAIIELPVEGNASCLAVCKNTGNFAIACGSLVKICSLVEKTVANSNKTYLDVEVFLELLWKFPIKSMALCEDYIVCCSHKEVQVIRIQYKQREKPRHKRDSTDSSLPSRELSSSSSNMDTVEYQNPIFYLDEAFPFLEQNVIDKFVPFTIKTEGEDNIEETPSSKEFSAVGMWLSGSQISKQQTSTVQCDVADVQVVDDDNFVEWNFDEAENGNVVCLPGLHSGTVQCHRHTVSPPVLTDLSVGKVKSSSGFQAETILHLNDIKEQENWLSVILVPAYGAGLPSLSKETLADRLNSSKSGNRTTVCCYLSGIRGGYLYQIFPFLKLVSSYKYTDQAYQVGLSQSHLHIVTTTGIETYTSRWGIVSIQNSKNEVNPISFQQSYPPSSLDICLCGHEPFFGAVSLSVGQTFLALLSKVYDSSGKDESLWSVYILHMHKLVDQFKEMISFAEEIQRTGPASYIHLLQEAHLLLSTHPLSQSGDPEVLHCLCQVNRMLGDFYAQPGQDDGSLCASFYKNCRASVKEIVFDAMELAAKNNENEFGKGLIDYLDSILFSQEDFVSLDENTCNSILKIYANSSAENLSKVILFSNMKSYTTEVAYHSLQNWLVAKAQRSQVVNPMDKLAIVHLQLVMCDVESAISQLMTIQKQSLVDIGSSHLSLICENMSTFTPLAQLMRQHMANTLLEILVEMLDKCIISLDSLLTLLNCQSDHPYNNHSREILELILTDSKRVFLFEEAVHMLCKVYISKLCDKTQSSTRQVPISGQQKFSLPQGNGHFAPRYAWLDYLPPFYDPGRISRPCIRLEIKQMSGQVSRSVSVPIPLVNKQSTNERCHCCSCNESLLKLQSLLCSPRLTTDLATFVLAKLEESTDDVSPTEDAEHLESIKLLCLIKLDVEKAMEQIVDQYPCITGSFASSCFRGRSERYTYLLRYMESVIKQYLKDPNPGADLEETYVKAYKDLLSRLTETFPPSQFLDLLPNDGNFFFLLPFLCDSLNREHISDLKKKVIDMGKQLMSQSS